MTKGLHKNSLRKVDNPHQWMVDDARMELIQQIRVEVERLKIEREGFRDAETESELSAFYNGQAMMLDEILSLLSSLEKEEKPSEGLEEEIQNQIYNHFFDLHGIAITGTTAYASVEDMEYIARHFAQWGAEHAKEKLMKEAVEGIVTTRSMAGNIVTAYMDHQFKPGQVVKLIIVKED